MTGAERDPIFVFHSFTQCHNKTKYPVKWMAQKDADSLAAINPQKKFIVYECPHCGSYHVGSDIFKQQPARKE